MCVRSTRYVFRCLSAVTLICSENHLMHHCHQTDTYTTTVPANVHVSTKIMLCIQLIPTCFGHICDSQHGYYNTKTRYITSIKWNYENTKIYQEQCIWLAETRWSVLYVQTDFIIHVYICYCRYCVHIYIYTHTYIRTYIHTYIHATFVNATRNKWTTLISECLLQ